jgi:hypothetical protein
VRDRKSFASSAGNLRSRGAADIASDGGKIGLARSFCVCVVQGGEVLPRFAVGGAVGAGVVLYGLYCLQQYSPGRKVASSEHRQDITGTVT